MTATASALQHPHAAPPPPGTAIEVAPDLLWLRMPLPFALDHINLWLVRAPGGHVLVDAGYGDAATRALWERHGQATLRGAPIVRIVATHYHPDHLGNAAWLSARFDAAVAMTQAEFLTAHAVAEQHSTHTVRDTCGLFRRHGMDAAHVEAHEARGNRYSHGVPELPQHFERLLAGDRVRAGGHAFEVIAGYGHSPEHAALYDRQARVLISGDMLLPKITTNVAVWPADPDGDPLARFLRSLDAFAALPPDTLVLPSHGLPFRGAAARVAALRAHHAARLSELEAAVAAAGAPQSAADVVPVLFRRPLDAQQRFFAMGEAIAHMNHLWHAGRLARRVSDDGTIRYAQVK